MSRHIDEIYHSKRGKHGVGKVIGRDKWVHISAIDAIIEEEQSLVKRAITLLPAPLSQDTDIIIKVNIKENSVMFAESPDWNTASEPAQGKTMTISKLDMADPKSSRRNPPKNPRIYHHKWMFVKDDYPGFDMKESMHWSETWKNSEVLRKLKKENPNDFVQIGGAKVLANKCVR